MTKKYLPAWEGQKSSMLRFDLTARSLVRHPEVISNDVPEYISYVYGKENGAYYREDIFERIKKTHAAYFLDPKNIEALPRSYDAVIEDMEKFYTEIRATSWEKMSNADLAELFDRYVALAELCTAHFRSTREELEPDLASYIRALLAGYFSAADIPKLFETVVSSPEKSVVGLEREAWLQFLRDGWSPEGALEYVARFPANVANFYGDEILAHLKQRHAVDTVRIDIIARDIEELGESRIVLACEQAEIFARCADERLLLYARALQRFGLERFRLKHYFWGAEFHVHPLLCEIMRRMDMSADVFFQRLQVDDISTFLREGKSVPEEELSARARCVVIAIEHDELRYYSGKPAEDIVKRIRSHDVQVAELKGSPAYPGFVRGSVRLIHVLDAAELERLEKVFAPGDILVTGNTDPSLVLFMQKAGAVVTHAGGVTSHAAIVSREYKVPCVVGVKDAMRFLKEDDYVEVNATKGTVRVIPLP